MEKLHVTAKSKPYYKYGKDGVESTEFQLWAITGEAADVLIKKKKMFEEYANYLSASKAPRANIENHLKELKEWLDKKKEEGYNIEWSVW